MEAYNICKGKKYKYIHLPLGIHMYISTHNVLQNTHTYMSYENSSFCFLFKDGNWNIVEINN